MQSRFRAPSGDRAPDEQHPPDPREERRAAEQAALRILGGAAQSEAALRHRLERRGFSAEASSAAAASAVGAGYVDDGALARSIVERRRGRRGSVRIAAELRARGLGDEVVRSAVAGVSPEEQRESAVREARRRLRGGLPEDRVERRRVLGRIAGALSRLGFSGDAIAHALAQAGADAPDDA
ncbi:MAG TPA: regulatory protein RecX [Candidatus Angelobacter sp.]|jgi:regulatory protein|nr:regulatory protein RecX [Candidatus Angelobacter sp.]